MITAAGPGAAPRRAASGSAISASSSQKTISRVASQPSSSASKRAGARTSGTARIPHCSAASTALARMRSSLTRATWVRRVMTGCSTPAPISTAFWTM